ncbi:MAG TPA: M20/M25/M40 family metallo-hydrolase [Vicinamibacterales bacterium]|nr:M20/M25/M40 family metallo-hydrolase [Vicinamibacterales bacterium]
MNVTRSALMAVWMAVLAVLAGDSVVAQRAPADLAPLGHAILEELIETNTTLSSGSTTLAAERMAARLIAAGFPRGDVMVVGGADQRKNLVARLRGRAGGGRPVLFFAHLDVVEARRDDWSMDPFALTERDGYFYGRGTLDVKGGAATLVTAFCSLRQRGVVPDRDLILALTADEEGGPNNGVQWLLANDRDLIGADYAINVDAGGPEIRGGRVSALTVQAAEKVFASFTLTVHNRGGHSSLPGPENAIYRLAAGLQRLATLVLPTHTSEITRAYFAAQATLASGANAADMRAVSVLPTDEAAARRLSASSPFYNAMLRTTCVPTLLEGGHAENALPQTARATINCRVLPEEQPADVMQTLVRAIADPQVEVAPVAAPTPSPPSPLRADLRSALERIARDMWGRDLPLVPVMETGATDGLYLRNAGMPVYGVTGIAYDPEDNRSHGKDERILVRAFDEGLVFIERLVAAVGGGPAPSAAR